MEIKATIFNYTNHSTFNAVFPMTDEKLSELMAKGEVMVDGCAEVAITGEIGVSLKEFNEAVKKFEEIGITVDELKILSKTYLFNEIVERAENRLIIDFDDETSTWSSSDFYSESDKGRVLYDADIAKFPVPVPKELEEYMDFAKLWRDNEVNMGLRCVIHDGTHYIVSM